ncbi:hypothetical protein [Brachybacterium hainanense]|uniref:Uncharacterized protein n=1 Tax=Brachybacterium hainanense TaxID=1541174 RepID=A0ABV6RC55_9MICO
MEIVELVISALSLTAVGVGIFQANRRSKEALHGSSTVAADAH